MAKAESVEAVVEVMVPRYETQKVGVKLELDHDEAQFLADVLGKIGGHPSDTRRKHASAMEGAMAEAGYTFDPARLKRDFTSNSHITVVGTLGDL